MKPVFHDSKAKVKQVSTMALDVGTSAGLKSVSDVKRDGKVFVKFRSTSARDALSMSMDFLDCALEAGWDAGYDSERDRVWVRIDSVLV